MSGENPNRILPSSCVSKVHTDRYTDTLKLTTFKLVFIMAKDDFLQKDSGMKLGATGFTQIQKRIRIDCDFLVGRV